MILNALLVIGFFINILLILLIFFKKPRSINIFFGISMIGIALWQLSIISLVFNFSIIRQYLSSFIGPTISFWALLIFVLHYPKPKFNLSKIHYGIISLPVLFFMVVIIFFQNYLIEITPLISQVSSQITPSYKYGPLFVWFIGYMLCFCIGIVAILTHNIRVYKGFNKIKSIYLLLAILISACWGALANLILPRFFNIDTFIQFGPTPFFFSLLLFFYSIIKYRFLDIHLIIKKGIIYTILTTVIFAFFSTSLFLLGRIFEYTLQVNQFVTAILVSLGIAVFYPYLKNFIDRITDFIFFKRHYNYQETLKQFSQKLSTTLDPNKINHQLIDTLSTALKVKYIGIFFAQDTQEFCLKSGFQLGPEYSSSIQNTSELIQFLSKNPKILMKEELKFRLTHDSDLKEKLQRLLMEMEALSAMAILPIMNKEKLTAIVCLGDKLSEDSLSSEDINLLETILHHTNTATQNSINYMQLKYNLINLQQLYEFTNNINRSLDIENIAKHFCKIQTDLFHTDTMILMVYSTEKKHFYPFYAQNIQLSLLPNLKINNQILFEKMDSDKIWEISEEDERNHEGIQLLRHILSLYYPNSELLCIPFIKNNQPIVLAFCCSKQSNKALFINQKVLLSTLIESTVSAFDNALLYNQVLEIKNFNEKILRNMITGVITLDQDLTITSFNAKAEEMLQVKAEDVLNQPISFLYSYSKKFKLFETSFKFKKGISQEAVLRKNDKDIPIALSIDLLHDTANRDIGVIGVLSDLSALKILQRQIDQATRLSSIGTLASGIAHEIKNPLVSIKTFSDLLPKMWDDQSFRKKYIEIVGPQINRINNLCQALLKLGKPQPPELSNFNINDVINDVLILLEGERKNYSAIIQTQLDPNAIVLADKNQLSQVLINVIMNSFQALSGIDRPGKFVWIQTEFKKNSGYVCLKIQDTGCGMSKEGLNKLFDPYYTTKPNGNGLGMSIVYKIIQEHRGRILVYSEQEKGTTFYIYIPSQIAMPEKLEEEEFVMNHLQVS